MTDSKDTSPVNIRQNMSIIDVLKRKTAEAVRSQNPHSGESSNSNLPVPQEKDLSPQLPAVYGGPVDAKNSSVQGLLDVSKKLNSSVSTEAVEILTSFVDKVSRGPGTALPMRCNGERCQFLHVCPLYAAKITLPVGHKCPVEANLVSLWVNKHLLALGITDIDNPENSFDMDMLYELATQELIRYRCSAKLSENPNLVENKQVGESFTGNPIFADVINPVLDVMEKAGKNIAKIRDALLATRRAQLRLGEVVVDATEKAAELRRKAIDISKSRLGPHEEMKNANYTILGDEDEPV